MKIVAWEITLCVLLSTSFLSGNGYILCGGNRGIPFEGCYIKEEKELSCYDIGNYCVVSHSWEGIERLALSSNRQYLAFSSRYNIVVWDMYEEKVKHFFTSPSPTNITDPNERFINYLKFSPDGRFLVARRDVVAAWNLEADELVGGCDFHNVAKVSDVVTTSEGRSFILGKTSGNERFCMVDIETKQVVFEELSERFEMRGESNGKHCMIYESWSDQPIVLFDCEKKDYVADRNFPLAEDVVLSLDGKRIVAPQSERGYVVQIWNVPGCGRRAIPCREDTGYVAGIVLSPDEKKMIVDSFDDVMRVFDLESYRLMTESRLHVTNWSNKATEAGSSFGPPRKHKVQFSPNSLLVLSYVNRCRYSNWDWKFSRYPFCLWEASSGKFIQRFHHDSYRCLKFVPGGNKIVGHDGVSVYFFRPITQKDFEGLTQEQMAILWLFSNDRVQSEIDYDVFEHYNLLPKKFKNLIEATRVY